jgi:hypothetical protein
MIGLRFYGKLLEKIKIRFGEIMKKKILELKQVYCNKRWLDIRKRNVLNKLKIN